MFTVIPMEIYFVLGTSLFSLGMAWYFASYVIRASEGTDRMKEIARYVREGAIAYLRQQYKVVVIVFVVIALLFGVMAHYGYLNSWVPFAFLTGGFFSGLAGYFGMRIATLASARVANACRTGLNGGLKLALRAGAVMGLIVVGLSLLDISLWFIVLKIFYPESGSLIFITTTMLTFGMGASLQALFARVGGGIFTKAADVGADLVGKVEAGIPEDDPRNPATIADNVGDNVGDVNGMGADLYESFVGAILATAALGSSAYILNPTIQLKSVLAPMMIAAVGTIVSVISVFLVKTKEGATQKDLMGSLSKGINSSYFLVAILSLPILYYLDIPYVMGKWLAILVGLVAGIVIGKGTEYYTSHAYRPTQRIAESAQTGAATVIISGLGTGMMSTAVPILAVVFAIVLSYSFATGFESSNVMEGLYGIGLAAVGMLSNLGISLATDAYGPIADNAGGNAEMAELPPEVRKRTDALDALGNTTAAVGKGFAIGSAALTALALLASYVEELKIAQIRLGHEFLSVSGINVPIENATIKDFMIYYDVQVMNPFVLVGFMIGAMMTYVFSGLTMQAVGRSAQEMVEEVRRQFRDIPGIMTGEGKPDYQRCVMISTKSAQKEMFLPAIIAVLVPILTGSIFGIPAVFGLLVGGLGTAFAQANFLSNSGGSWDNAKKYVEEGHLGGKGSDVHKATVIGDTVGDPFKDTSGPSLNILIKLMAMVAIVFSGLHVAFSVF